MVLDPEGVFAAWLKKEIMKLKTIDIYISYNFWLNFNPVNFTFEICIFASNANKNRSVLIIIKFLYLSSLPCCCVDFN